MMKRNAKISLIFLVLVFVDLRTSDAQVVCFDVNPNITIVGSQTVNIDLNNDAIDDFRIILNAGTLLVKAATIGTGNYVLANGFGGALALQFGTPIGATSANWVQMNSANQLMNGSWLSAVDQYLGLKLVVGINTYYGWARFSCPNNFVFKSYAYESSSNQTIAAGAVCGSNASPSFSLNTVLCTYASPTLVANTGTQVPSSYYWSGSSVVFSAPTSSATTITFLFSGLNYVSLTVTSGTLTGTMQYSVMVNSANFNLASNDPVCSGQALTFTVTGTSSSTLSGPSGFASTTSVSSISSASLANSGIYTLVAVNYTGCEVSYQKQITIYPLPSFTITPSSPSLCPNSQGSLVTASTTASSLTWSPSLGLSNTTNSIVTVNPVSTTVYTVTGSKGFCTNAVTVTVTVMPPPILAATGATICQNQSANLTATLYLGGVATYAWVGLNLSTTVQNPVILLPPPGIRIYTITATSDVGCSATTTVELLVSPLPIFSVTATHSVICRDTESDTLSVSGSAVNYVWGPDNGLSNTAGVTVTANPTITTTYTVIGTNSNLCSGVRYVTVYVDDCTGINILDPDKLFSIYPIPLAEHLYIESKQSFETTIAIKDVAGKTVLKQDLTLHAGIVECIDMRELPPGIYFVALQRMGYNALVKKVIK